MAEVVASASSDLVAQRRQPEQLELGDSQNGAPPDDPDEGRPSLLSLVLTMIDTLYMVFVILTSPLRPAYTIISSVGGIILSVLFMVIPPMILTVSDNLWERHIAKRGLVPVLKVMLMLSTIGIFMSALSAWAHESAWLDYIGLLTVFICRPIEPVITAAVTFDNNKPAFMKQLRLRRIGFYVGGWLAVVLSSIAQIGDGKHVASAIGALNCGVGVLYFVTWFWVKRATSDPTRYRVGERASVSNLFVPRTDMSKLLTDITIRNNANNATQYADLLKKFIRYIITNGALANVVEFTLVALVVGFTGDGKTGDCVLAVFLVALLAVLLLLAAPFDPDHRSCMFGGRAFAGVLVIAVAIAAPFLYSSGMDAATSDVAWTTLLVIPLLVLVHSGDQPLADVARYTLLTASSVALPTRDYKTRKTMYLYAVATSTMVELAAVANYAAVKHGGGWACFGVLFAIGIALVISTVTASRVEKHIVHVLSQMQQPPVAAGTYAVNGNWREYFCCWRKGSDSVKSSPSVSVAGAGQVSVNFSIGSDPGGGEDNDSDEDGGVKFLQPTTTSDGDALVAVAAAVKSESKESEVAAATVAGTAAEVSGVHLDVAAAS